MDHTPCGCVYINSEVCEVMEISRDHTRKGVYLCYFNMLVKKNIDFYYFSCYNNFIILLMCVYKSNGKFAFVLLAYHTCQGVCI